MRANIGGTRLRPRHAIKKLGVLLGLLSVIGAGLVVYADSAFANDADLTASTECPEPFAPNTYVVEYTATSWSSGQLGANPDIRVEYSVNGAPFVVGAQFAFPNQPTIPSHQGAFTVSSPGTIKSLMVQTHAGADWESGNTERGPWFTQQLTLPGDCEQPGVPTASAEFDCAVRGAAVTVGNSAGTGGQPVTFEITAPAGTSPAFAQTTPPIAPGGSTVVVVPFEEGETRTITATAPDLYETFTFVRDCEHPAALVSHACATSGLDVSVQNVGNGAGTFSIDGVSQVLAPGQVLSRNVPVAEGASVEVAVLLDGQPVAGSPFTFVRDCEHPAALVSHACATSGLDVSVQNVGNGAGTFSIDGVSQVLAPGQVLSRNVPVAEGASVEVAVLLDGQPVAGSPFTFVRDCEHPAALVSHACATSGLDVSVQNVGNGAGTFSIDGVSQVLAPGQVLSRNVPVAEGASVEVAVLLDGQPVAGSPFTFVRDCEHPGATAMNNCNERGADVVISNAGDAPATLEISKDGVPIDVVVVPGSDVVSRFYPLAEDELATFRVTGDGFDSGPLIVNHDCAQVSAPPTVVVSPPATGLPVTGATTTPVAVTGALLLAVGMLAMLGAGRKPRSSSLR